MRQGPVSYTHLYDLNCLYCPGLAVACIRVKGNRKQQNAAADNVLERRVKVHQAHAVVKCSHDQRSGHCTGHGAVDVYKRQIWGCSRWLRR